MNLSSLAFFRTLRPDHKKQFAVIGLGRFGRAVCLTLRRLGYEVLAMDADEKRVAASLTDQVASHILQLDSTQSSALHEAGVFELDTVIVAIGNYVEESIITTLNLKEGGVPHVIAKASSEIHEKLLRKVGADHVVFPEHETGCSLAHSLTRPGILDRFELDPDHSIVEVVVPPEFDGKTIAELELRNRYGLNLLAVSQDDKFEINPRPERVLHQGSAIVVIGCNTAVEKLPLR
ncbi:potassium transporter [Leptolyngbya sp. 'hensonii']|uniref:potassium channel family protein n=1 Tax=Leptolyngbya sp. 'hensonii' TaxID=1922337 RepID=UPI00094F7325|nr:TrkA family potassium uptake protein [Leptolyngbya sp. 'hensonii']OLP18909.1 potassium transporter [Leptolyngbya sp. 'hensonii']